MNTSVDTNDLNYDLVIKTMPLVLVRKTTYSKRTGRQTLLAKVANYKVPITIAHIKDPIFAVTLCNQTARYLLSTSDAVAYPVCKTCIKRLQGAINRVNRQTALSMHQLSSAN